MKIINNLLLTLIWGAFGLMWSGSLTAREFSWGPLRLDIPEKAYQFPEKTPPADGPFLNLTLPHTEIKGQTLVLMAFRLDEKKLSEVSKKTGAEQLGQLAGQFTQNNKAPKMAKPKKIGKWQVTYFNGKNPSGRPFQMALAVTLQKDRLAYLILGKDGTAGTPLPTGGGEALFKELTAIIGSDKPGEGNTK